MKFTEQVAFKALIADIQASDGNELVFYLIFLVTSFEMIYHLNRMLE